MTESLFTTETPALPDNSDGTPGITTAVNLKFAVPGTVNVRWYCTTNAGGTWTGLVWRKTNSDPDTGGGALVDSAAFSGTPTGGAWNRIVLGAAVNDTDYYTVGVHNDQGRYVATTHFAAYDSGGGGLTSASGNVHAVENGTAFPSGGTMFQGLFQIDASPAYPGQSGNGSNYFIDVEFTPDGGGPTVSVWDGSAEVAATVTVWDGTTEVAATVDQVTT